MILHHGFLDLTMKYNLTVELIECRNSCLSVEMDQISTRQNLFSVTSLHVYAFTK